LWLNSPDLDAFSLFHQLRDTTRNVNQDGKLAVENLRAYAPVQIVLDQIEAILISAAEPPHNLQGGRFGNDVKQYIQRRDEEKLGPSIEEAIKQLYESQQAI
jgi:hypothetical protein